MSELNFRWLFDSAPDAMLVIDEAGRIVEANPLLEKLFGYSSAELLGNPVEMLMPPRFRDIHQQHRMGYNRNPHPRPMGAGLALFGQRRDGSEFPVEISLSATHTGEGLLALAAIRDTTERRRTEQELERHRHHLEELVAERTESLQQEVAERKRIEARQQELLDQVAAANDELQRFAYVVSHDLKAPLRAIDNLASWLVEDYADRLDDAGKEQLSLLAGRVQRMGALIDGVLEYSRLGRIREELVLVDLNEIVREAVDLLSPPAEATVTVADPLPQVVAERTRMLQVFQNLIGNALRYNDKPQPRVEVRCRVLGDAWQISVADNGIGIDSAQFDKVFQMFQTLAARDKSESTGVGLTLVKRIVELNGGAIWLESTPGEGSVFHFTLPKHPAASGKEPFP